jgi:hypothetical protein
MKHDDDCPLCAATKRVFGDRFYGCATIANDMALEATKLIKNKADELLAELESKHERGEVSDEDHALLGIGIKHSFPFAASNVPSVALVSGADCDPPTMMQLVQENMVHLVQSVFQRRLDERGPEAIIELMMMIREARREADHGDTDPNDPNMN